MVGSLQIFLAGGEVVAFYIRLLAVHQVQIGHGVVVIRTQRDGLVEILNTFRDRGPGLLFQFCANFFLVFVLGIQILIWLQAKLGALFHARLVASRPVNNAHGVVRLGIVGIHIGGHAVILLGVVEFLHVQVQVSDSLGGVYFLIARRIHVEHFLVLLNGLVSHLKIIGALDAGNVLLSVSRSQVHLGVNEGRVQGNALLEVIDGLFVLGVLISGDALVKLVAR